MKRFLIVVIAAAGIVASAACNKPEADDCRKAIVNMEQLIGTSQLKGATDIEGEVRRCKGGSSQKAVACAIAATTVDQLKACGFMGSKSAK